MKISSISGDVRIEWFNMKFVMEDPKMAKPIENVVRRNTRARSLAESSSTLSCECKALLEWGVKSMENEGRGKQTLGQELSQKQGIIKILALPYPIEWMLGDGISDREVL